MPNPTSTPSIEPPAISGAKPSTPDAGVKSAEAAVAAEKAGAENPFNDAFSELESLSAAPKNEAAQPAPKLASAAAKPSEPKAGLESSTQPEGEKASSAQFAKPATKEPGSTPKELRAAFESQKAELKKLQGELETLRAAKPPEDTEKKVALETLEKERQRRQQLEEEISFLDYTKSEEFLNTYKKPYEQAWARAIGDIEQLDVPEGDGSRKATAQDLMELANMPLGTAWKVANERFGAAAGSIMHHREVIRDLHAKQQEALETRKAQGAEHQKKAQLAQGERARKLNSMWEAENKRVQERFAQWFAPDPEDPEGNEKLSKGFATVDQMFNGTKLDPEKAVLLHVAVRNKAAAFDRLLHRNRKLQAQVEQLTKDLGEFRKSEPGAGSGEGRSDAPGTKQGPLTPEQELDQLAAGS